MEIITVSPTKGKPGVFDAFWRGQFVARSERPFVKSCRVLLDKGVDPGAWVVMTHQGSNIPSIRGRLGKVARVSVRETKNGPAFQWWQPFTMGADR